MTRIVSSLWVASCCKRAQHTPSKATIHGIQISKLPHLWIWETLCVFPKEICPFNKKKNMSCLNFQTFLPKDWWIHRYTWIPFDLKGFHVFSLWFSDACFFWEKTSPCFGWLFFWYPATMWALLRHGHQNPVQQNGWMNWMQKFNDFASRLLRLFGLQVFKYVLELASKYGSWELQSWRMVSPNLFERLVHQTELVSSFTCQIASMLLFVNSETQLRGKSLPQAGLQLEENKRLAGCSSSHLPVTLRNNFSEDFNTSPSLSTSQHLCVGIRINIPTYRRHHDNEYKLLTKESHWLLRHSGELCLFKGEANIEGDAVKLSRSETFATQLDWKGWWCSTYITPAKSREAVRLKTQDTSESFFHVVNCGLPRTGVCKPRRCKGSMQHLHLQLCDSLMLKW